MAFANGKKDKKTAKKTINMRAIKYIAFFCQYLIKSQGKDF